MAAPLAALPMFAAIASGVGSAWNQASTARQSRENTILEIEARKYLQDDAYKKNLEMWHMQNMYNAPQQQMDRFRDAGLNPHLIYGQGSSGLAQAPPQYVPPQIGVNFAAPQPGDAIQAALPMLMQIGSWVQDMRSKEVDIQQKLSLFPVRQELTNYQRDYALENVIGKAGANARLLEEFRKLYGSELDIRYMDTPYRYATGSGLRDIDIRRAEAEARLKEQETGYYGARLRKAFAEAERSELGVEYYEPALLMKAVLGGAGLLIAGARAGAMMGSKELGKRLSTYKPPKRVKTYYQGGRRRSQVVDYD